MDQELFGGLLIYLVGAAVIAACVYGYCKLRGKAFTLDKINLTRYLCCIAACILYFLIICKTSSNTDTRYLSPFYSVLFSVVVCGIYILCKSIVKQRYIRIVLVAVLAILTLESWQSQQWPYLYKSTKPLLETMSQYADTDCLCIYSESWRMNPLYEEASNFNSITFYRADDLDMLALSDLSSRYGLIVVTDRYLTVDDQDVLDRILHMCPDIGAYEEIGRDIYSITYYLHPIE